MRIPLADHQAWEFPLPRDVFRLLSDDRREQYTGLLRARVEAEDISETRLADLALAIFLIELNYELEPRDLEVLFSFPPGSAGLARAQDAFQSLAFAHLEAIHGMAKEPLSEKAPSVPSISFWTRWVTWLRSLASPRCLSFNPAEGDAPL